MFGSDTKLLTHFMPLFSFYIPENIRSENQMFFCFLGLLKENSGMKWVKWHNWRTGTKLGKKHDIVFPVDYDCPVSTYLFKVTKRNTRMMCGICSELTLKTPARRDVIVVFLVSIFNFEEISHIFMAFPLLNLKKQMLVD